jgi:glycosyltransferase involved in cell wall biosynthesis
MELESLVNLHNFSQDGVKIVINSVESLMKITVLMPVYNERENIEIAIKDLLSLKNTLNLELIVIESNSSELRTSQGFILVLEDKARGKGHAVRNGLQHATGDLVVIIDGDNEYDVNDLVVLYNCLESSKSRLVLGNRHIAGKRMRNFTNEPIKTFYYNLGHIIFTTFFNYLFGTRLIDPATMWKLFYRSDVSKAPFIGKRFEFDWELLAFLVREGASPIEIPITYISRSHQQGKKIRTFRDPILWIAYIIYFRFRKHEK